ncbi:MAG: hypothetical protein ACO3QQ_07390, partial [Candidatus Nanopelagicaceae bacterium]
VDAINFLIAQYNRLPFSNIGAISLGGGGAVGNFQMSTGSSLGGGAASSTTLSGLVGALGGLGSTVAGLSGSVAGSKGGGTPGQLKALSNIERDFAMLQSLVAQLTGESPSTMNQTSAEDLRFQRAININVNAPSVIDETGFTRAVVDALNSVERRQAGGYSALLR